MADDTWVLLLRGINVGGHRKVPMAELRELAAECGFEDVRTYVNSGNLVGSVGGETSEISTMMENALLDRFGFEVDVLVLDPESLAEAARGGVFPEAEEARANLVHVVFGRLAATDETLTTIESYRAETESVQRVGDEIWIDYADGSARTKISHAVLRRAFGGPVTSRNFRTVRKLAAMVAEHRV